jgi:hypothetical protein
MEPRLLAFDQEKTKPWEMYSVPMICSQEDAKVMLIVLNHC